MSVYRPTRFHPASEDMAFEETGHFDEKNVTAFHFLNRAKSTADQARRIRENYRHACEINRRSLTPH